MTTSNINSTPNVVSTSVVPGLIGPMDIEPMVINFCDVARTNSAIIHYVEKKNRDGSTIFISEAAAKTKSTSILLRTQVTLVKLPTTSKFQMKC